jgi:hypothetical protein
MLDLSVPSITLFPSRAAYVPLANGKNFPYARWYDSLWTDKAGQKITPENTISRKNNAVVLYSYAT